MSPDDYQQAWQAHSSETRVTIDTDLLLKEVQRSQKDFRAMILLRDFREAGISILMIPLWFYLGFLFSPVWTWYLTVPALIGVSGFIIVDRMRHKQKLSEPGESLLDSVRESLAQVEHQIWLLRNIVWWYLMPFAVPLLIFFAHTSWSLTGNLLLSLVITTMPSVFVLALYYFIYYLNQYAVRKQLEPRRQELLALLTSLRDETTSKVSGEYPILMSPARFTCSRRRLVIAGLLFVVFLSIGIGGIYLGKKLDQGYPKKTPFAAVRWQESQPEVRVGDEWYTLVSLDGIAAEDIVAFCKRTYEDKWQMRFGEDLIEVLAGMGHHPKDTVTLVVLPIGSSTPRTLESVLMTFANRQAIRDARVAESRNEPKAALTELVPALRQENKLVGLAAMVMVDGKLIESAVDGERKTGSGVKVAIGDLWHLGSITKSVTATMIARLVESGKMQWTDTIGGCFPDAPIHEDWKAVTLRQLLTHTAGAPANFSMSVMRNKPALGAESTKARREAVLNVLAKKPENAPGTKYAYSNVGFTIAGAMAEQVTGETWDALVKREVFEPLSLTSAGFGPPKSGNKPLEQPQGHTSAFGWKFGVGEEADNTTIIGPSGIAHMTLEDLCTYATEHLRGESGESELLNAETYALLHKPELDNYACGWVKKEPNAEIPYTVYWHNGSNTMWYALVVFIPETNMVVAVTSNDGDIANAEAAAWEVVKASAKRINVEADTPRREPLQRTDYPKKPPFAGVRWQESPPEVKVGEEWFQFVSLGELPASEIVAFSRRTYGNNWRKRFEEDLVELLTSMGHPPQDKATLVVQSLTSSETSVREGVVMTEANRRAIRAAAQTLSIPER